MQFKIFGIALTLLFITTQTYSQSSLNSVESLVVKGIQHHDNGEYDKAIQLYEKALEIEPNSPLVNYEIALSYFSKKNLKKAIEYSEKVIKQNKEYLLEAYIVNGSALNSSGKAKEAIKVFNKAIKRTKGHYLLYYNLALTYHNQNEADKAEENLIKAIEDNPKHQSSHLMLTNIHYFKGNNVRTLLAAHYFLFLEPNSPRSKVVYNMLKEKFTGNVSKDENKPNTINITLSKNEDSQFGAVELMISMLEVSRTLEKNEGKTDDEMFIENTESFFKVLGELKKKSNKEIWWTFYTTFFYDLANSEHLETYCHYISQSENENSRKWLDENEDKLADFEEWLVKNHSFQN